MGGLLPAEGGHIRVEWRVGGECGNAISVGLSICVRWKFSLDVGLID